jgi:hypothetical protein
MITRPRAKLISIALSIAASFTAITSARADFEGVLVLEPPGCEQTGHCTLGNDFGFVDGQGLGWQAAKGLLTDGASIPPWAQPIVGQPFAEAYIKAAIIHDHYCDRHVRPWRQTHKVFHEALLKSNVDPVKAGMMYFAVLIGGPKWAKLVQGKPCPVGMGCINNFDLTASLPGANIGFGSNGELFLMRQELYGSASFANKMDQNTPKIMALGQAVTAEQVEAIAKDAMADDFYFMNDDEVGTGLNVIFQ